MMMEGWGGINTDTNIYTYSYTLGFRTVSVNWTLSQHSYLMMQKTHNTTNDEKLRLQRSLWITVYYDEIIEVRDLLLILFNIFSCCAKATCWYVENLITQNVRQRIILSLDTVLLFVCLLNNFLAIEYIVFYVHLWTY